MIIILKSEWVPHEFVPCAQQCAQRNKMSVDHEVKSLHRFDGNKLCNTICTVKHSEADPAVHEGIIDSYEVATMSISMAHTDVEGGGVATLPGYIVTIKRIHRLNFYFIMIVNCNPLIICYPVIGEFFRWQQYFGSNISSVL